MSSIYDFQETAVYEDEPMEKADNSILTYIVPIAVLAVLNMVPIAAGLFHYFTR
ncbi:hypothetical protein ACFOEK_15825 [Litoribrevibacter euphylliae]|uniref:Uncharacterized protein n=1 Tax=Litoribrevibacter euphylliae TaxID=1834034 RepID=A0ABV7HF27_9GAMM